MKLNRLFTYCVFIIFISLLILISKASSQDRKIRPGDSLEITVYGHQDLSRVVTVNPQGTIDFPFMQNLPVDGLTLERLRELIVAQLSRYLENYPVVTVSFAKSSTITVNVLGQVVNPGIIQIPQNSTLQGAIWQAGGAVPGAKIKSIQLIRNQDGEQKSYNYNLESFLLNGDLKQNPVLINEDIIIITGNPVYSNVKVLGCVNNPGTFTSFSEANVLEMIFQAGGTSDDANLSKIRHISPGREKSFEVRIDLNKYLKSPEYFTLPEVKAGDIIYVPKKLNLWQKTFGIARDLSVLVVLLWYVDRTNIF